MKLQGRDLRFQDPPQTGDDVKLLQTELLQLGLKIRDENEVKQAIFGETTAKAVAQFQEAHNLPVTAEVDKGTAALINAEVDKLQPGDQPKPFVVRGQVRADGHPLAGIVVLAFDKDLRSEQPLGKQNPTPTDQDGRYEISYTQDQFSRAEKGSADLIFKLVAASGRPLSNFKAVDEKGKPLDSLDVLDATGKPATIAIIPQAQAEEIVNFDVVADAATLPSEYERLLKELEPLLVSVTLPDVPTATLIDQLADLKKEDIDFLVIESQIERQKIEFLVAAALSEKAAQQDVAAAVFYGLAREGLPTDLAALGMRSQKARSDALDQALKENIIPANLRDSLADILAQLQRLALRKALETPPAEGKHSLGQLLGTALTLPEKQAAFLSAYANHDGPIEDFWKTLRVHPDFTEPGVVEKLQLSLQLGALTQNHVPLIEALQSTLQFKSTRDLVKLNTAAWTKLVNQQTVGLPLDVPGTKIEEKTANYVKGIVGVLQAAFPTDVVAQIVTTAPKVGLDDSTRKLVSQFFANAPDLDLRTSHVEKYIKANAAKVFDGIADGDRLAVTNYIKRTQRLFQVSTSSETMTALLGTGFDSAHSIAQIPRTNFLAMHSETLGSEQEAARVYERATAANARALHVYAQLYQSAFDVQPAAVGSADDAHNTIKTLPSYTELFGSLDFCDCEHCHSVYSPAAYFVDLLQFLKNSTPGGKSKRPLDVLLGRRPDLEHIKLTCENTNTPLPYVDLVNEVLESYVALGMKLDASTAQDSGDATAAELSANPQHTNLAAYKELSAAVFPLTLPFNQSLEVARTYLEHLGVSRYELMKTFQKSATLETDTAVAAEYLKISKEEFQVLTGRNLDGTPAEPRRPAREFFGYPQDDITRSVNNADVTKLWKEWLASVPEFLERTGVSYLDLLELLKSRFVNFDQPEGAAREFFLRIPLSFQTLAALVQDVFVATLDPPTAAALAKAGMTKEELQTWSDANFPTLRRMLVIASPESNCDLNLTTIQTVDGTPIDDQVWQRIHTFIRLWRKLGWSIANLDKAFFAIQDSRINPASLVALAEIKKVQASLNLPLTQLFSLWSNIDTQGDDSLYQKLFLNKAALNFDPNFQPGLDGAILADASLSISDHSSALLAALRINSGELAGIRAATGLADDTSATPPKIAALTLTNVSTLYRHAVLAKALKLSIKDLLTLKTLVGFDPFGTPDQTVRFIDIAEKLRQSGFAIAKLNYLYRHESEPSDGLAPQPVTVLLLAQSLRDGLTKIAEDNLIAPGPVGELTRNKLGLIFESAIVDQTVRMIDGSAIYTAPLANLPIGIARFGRSATDIVGIEYDKIPDALKNKISFDPKASVLQFTGPMATADSNLLSGLLAGLSLPADANFQRAIQELFMQPQTFIKDTLSGFLDLAEGKTKLLDQSSLGKDGKAVLLDAAGNPAANAAQAVTTAIAAKFSYLLGQFLPYLRDMLSHSLVKQTIGDALKLDGEMIDLLLESLLAARAGAKDRAIADFLGIREGGVSAEFFDNKDLLPTGNPPRPRLQRIDPVVDFDWGEASPDANALPADTFSARWTGKVLAQFSEEYTFHTDTNDGVRLWVDNQLLIDDWNDQPASTTKENSGRVKLKAGQLYDLRMEFYENKDNAVVRLSWSSASTPKAIIPASNLYPSSLLDNFAATFTLISKLALLVNGFKLTNKEVVYLSRHPADFDNFDFQALPLDRTNPIVTDQKAVQLFKQWLRLVELTTLRDSLPVGELGLLDLFAVAAASADSTKLSAAVTSKLVAVTGWDEQEIALLIDPSNFNLSDGDFKNEVWLVRLQSCLYLVSRVGVSTQQLFKWATNAPVPQQAQAIKNAVKAKYDDETWLTVAKPLNDVLRESQKGALVAYLLPRLGMIDSNQLFEYFLIDVDMSACMATSRIKQAISSVQLFVQRCLLNLEARADQPDLSVSPSAIDADQWKWLKHYRVWEANRKVFLYPENWIEPELRDDKSPFFRELESELLQSDLTNDSAETALLNYLEKLDQVARLEICGMYWQDKDPETFEEVNILHVFGRTFRVPHIYYYRRLVNNITWTSWEKVQVDIEGDHLIPVVWNRCLYLFWPVFVEKALQNSSENDSGRRYWEIKLAWSEFKQKSWRPKRLSKEFMVSPNFPNFTHELMPKAHYSFKAQTTDNQLVIQAYVHERLNGQGPSRYDGVSLFGEFNNLGCDDKFNISYNNRWYSGFELSHIITFKNTGFVSTNTITNSTSAFIISPPRCLVSFMDYLEGGEFHDDFVNLAGNLTLLTGNFGDIPALDDRIVARSVDEMTVLQATPTRFGLLLPHQFYQFDLQSPFFYQDDQRAYYVTPIEAYDFIKQVSQFDKVRLIPDRLSQQEIDRLHNISDPPLSLAVRSPSTDWAIRKTDGLRNWSPPPMGTGRERTIHLKFDTYFHPRVCEFIKALNRKGIPGLLDVNNQRTDEDFNPIPIFRDEYEPNPQNVVTEVQGRFITSYPREIVDFSFSGAYSLYNWELFFHVPLLIASRLSSNQRFEDAQIWFNYIFDPTDSSDESTPERYWKVVPFKTTESARIQDLFNALSAPADSEEKSSIIAQIEEWRQYPFRPHTIARMRPAAYMKNVIMKYIDNLIAWGDQLFGQDTIESINEATQLYVMAANLLGKRPQRIPSRGKLETETYATLKDRLDAFSNALAILENEFPSSSGVLSKDGRNEGGGLLGLGQTLYFCIPQNDKLLGYWDTVADRLFKIRHCMNIEGVVRELPLFEPPIDPALLVQAIARGVDLSSVLNDLNTATPHYRFNFMLQKALELCADLKSLGVALLSTLEKKDAEELSALRASHETNILNLIKEVKTKQLIEAQAVREGLEKTKAVTQRRFEYYRDIPQRIQQEKEHLDELSHANDLQRETASWEIVAQHWHLYFPDISYTQSAGPPSFGTSYGGSNIGAAANAFARSKSVESSDHNYQGTRSSILAGFDRRDAEWGLQKDLAQKELDQIQKQIEAASIREQIAQNEIDNHDKQIDNAKQIEEFLRDKYTNQDLYSWMMSEVSTIYFQCYQMAYDFAKKAEKAFRFERGLTTSNFIQFGYWDSLKKGLLSGERLYLALKQMERAHLEQNKREYEITKHVSLLLHDPMALIRLKETGRCEVYLPEALFDADYPGHYMRRLKSVGLTIPCVVGPYTSINCTLTLLSNKTRIKTVPTDPYSETLDQDDDRFVANFSAMQSIATSHAQNDSGMFELNFRDERFLPFEGAGVISRWRIDMPLDTNAFDFNTLTDVVLHLKYTAREGGEVLGRAAQQAMQALSADENGNMARLFSAKHEFPTEWYRFLHPAEATAAGQSLQIDLTRERFPFQLRGKTITITQVKMFLILKDEAASNTSSLNVSLGEKNLDDPASTIQTLGALEFNSQSSPIDKLPFCELESTSIKIPEGLVLTLTESDLARLGHDAIEDIWIVCQYSVT
jgi:peptidoglycan hydrolase-like protein with peptidoglycan-binding domain